MPVLSRKKTGKGSAYLLGFCLQDTAFTAWKDGDGASLDALRQLLWAITQEAGVTPMARSQNPEIEVSLRSNANAAYVLAINHEAAGARTRVFLIPPFSIGEVWNIANHAGQPFERIHGGIAFDLEVPRDRPQILRLLRQ